MTETFYLDKWNSVAEGYAHDPAHGYVRRLKQALEKTFRPTPFDSSFTSDELTVLFALPGKPVLLKATERTFHRFLLPEGRLLEKKQSCRLANFFMIITFTWLRCGVLKRQLSTSIFFDYREVSGRGIILQQLT